MAAYMLARRYLPGEELGGLFKEVSKMTKRDQAALKELGFINEWITEGEAVGEAFPHVGFEMAVRLHETTSCNGRRPECSRTSGLPRIPEESM